MANDLSKRVDLFIFRLGLLSYKGVIEHAILKCDELLRFASLETSKVMFK